MGDMMEFPQTVEEFMEDYKVTDRKQIYSNGDDYVPIFRMKQWFEHEQKHAIVYCKGCKSSRKTLDGDYVCKWMYDSYGENIKVNADGFCSWAESR